MLASFLGSQVPRVLDLGCGTGEYPTYDRVHDKYFGIDLNCRGAHCSRSADYREISTWKSLPFEPNAFISLFSTECHLDVQQKYDLYARLFQEIESLRYGLVSGVHYPKRIPEKTVQAVEGAIADYQTVERQLDHISPVFLEFRCEIPVSSTLFPDEVEVWKLLVRT
jgi:SAM-dependent methyltransferase